LHISRNLVCHCDIPPQLPIGRPGLVKLPGVRRARLYSWPSPSASEPPAAALIWLLGPYTS
jgi:hypothetical protein